VNGQPAHSLYTTSNRGVNEVASRKIPHRILIHEDVGSIHRATTMASSGRRGAVNRIRNDWMRIQWSRRCACSDAQPV